VSQHGIVGVGVAIPEVVDAKQAAEALHAAASFGVK
jgi:hypothetical protein